MTSLVTGPPTGIRGLGGLQRLGRSLMLPIATLPAAGLLLRLGQADMLGRWHATANVASVMAGAGNAIFSNLPLIFAVGIAIGWAKKADGSTAVAALVGYLVLQGVFKAMSPIVLGAAKNPADQAQIDYGVLAGVLMGLIAAVLWQRFYRIKLPVYLAFFGGRRFVPIITALTAIVLGVVMSFFYDWFNTGLTHLANGINSNTVAGGGVFGVVNRLLIPLGLHHIINSILWFQLGSYTGPSGVVHGDLTRFFAGDPHAGTFMTGFFPIMMFALPAAAIAIWHEARPEQRKVVGGIMLSTALTAFLTGITEPLEFSFMFVAWPLYVVHAVLTGTSLALTNALGIHDGFTFSAGFFDYAINFGQADKPLLIIPIGLAYAAVYYVLFRFVIRKWNLRTPGREEETADVAATPDEPVAAGAASAPPVVAGAAAEPSR